MALETNEIVRKLKDAGNRLLEPPPSSKEELLKFLEELELILSKVDQSPSKTIQEALLPSMKALISDRVLKNSDSDIKITIAVCFNEIMRITAPDSPYDDGRMKEIFELIVASFDKLSLLSGKSYSKALSIIDNVAKVRSCVMMLDLECDKLIIEMFEQFKKNLRSNHPHSVFLAMEDIMSLIIDESEDIPLELLKVLLDCVRKEKENTSPMSWRLGAKVMERASQKLKPYVQDAIKSGDIRKDDYAPLVDSILQGDSEIIKRNHVADSAEQVVGKEHVIDASSPRDAGDAAAEPVLSLETETKKDNERRPNEGHGSSSKKSLVPRGRPKKNSAVAAKTSNPSVEAVPSMVHEMLANSEERNYQESPVKPNRSGKKVGRPRKDATGGSGYKLDMNLSKKEKNRMDEWTKKMLRRKRDQMEEEVFETPFGKKKYEDIVGCRLKVWWPKDKTYYEGRVTLYDPITMKHRVDYDDGDVEVLNLVKEKFEFIGDEILANNHKMGVKPHHSSERANEDNPAMKAETQKSGSKDSNVA